MPKGRKKLHALIWWINCGSKDVVELSLIPVSQREVNRTVSLLWRGARIEKATRLPVKILAISSDREELDRTLITASGEIHDPSNKIFPASVLQDKKDKAEQEKQVKSIKASNKNQLSTRIGREKPICFGTKKNVNDITTQMNVNNSTPQSLKTTVSGRENSTRENCALEAQKPGATMVPIQTSTVNNKNNVTSDINSNRVVDLTINSYGLLNNNQPQNLMNSMELRQTTVTSGYETQGVTSASDLLHESFQALNGYEQQFSQLINSSPQSHTFTNFTEMPRTMTNDMYDSQDVTGTLNSSEGPATVLHPPYQAPGVAVATQQHHPFARSLQMAQPFMHSYNAVPSCSSWEIPASLENHDTGYRHPVDNNSRLPRRSDSPTNVHHELLNRNVSQPHQKSNNSMNNEADKKDSQSRSDDGDSDNSDSGENEKENTDGNVRALAGMVLWKVTKEHIAYQEPLLAAMKYSYESDQKMNADSIETFQVPAFYLEPGDNMQEVALNCKFYLSKAKIGVINLAAEQSEDGNPDWKILVREVLIEVYGKSLRNYSATGKRGGRPPIDRRLFKGLYEWANTINPTLIPKRDYIKHINKCAYNKCKYHMDKTEKKKGCKRLTIN